MAYDVERNLTNHAPVDGDGKVIKYEAIRVAAKHLARTIDALCPESREQSLAHTNLEQTVFWAVASIARDGH